MRRDPLPLVLILLLVLLGSVAWLTRDPDHPLLDWLAGRPGIGPAVERFREAYRGGERRPAEAGSEPAAAATEVVILERETRPDSVAPAARGRANVWVRAGTVLRQAPEPGSAVAATVEGLRRMAVLDERGDWRRLSQVGLEGSLTEGWVRQAELDDLSPDELRQPDPVLPLPAVPLSEEVLGWAREVVGEALRELPCGPFRLLTDVAGPVVESCPHLAGQLDALYARRTGLRPAGPAAEAILLFDSPGAYLIFRAWVSPESRRHAFAAPARGFVAVEAAGRPVEQIQETLVHELIHLLNRRHLGPALPPWLDEGLAEELAMSRIAADGTLTPGSLGSWEGGTGEVRLIGGGRPALADLRSRVLRGDLPTLETLTGLDRFDFQAEERFRVHYALSAFWVRYLLNGEAPAGREGFRGFLAAVATGQRLEEDLLLRSLGAGWPELETGFRRWLDAGGGEMSVAAVG